MQAVPVVVAPAAVVGVQELEQLDVQQVDQNGGTIVAVAAPGAVAVAPVLSLSQTAVGVVGAVTPGAMVPRQLVYPLALAKHEEVVASKELFFDTLNKFHTALGTRLTKKRKKGRAPEVQSFQESLQGIPKIAGKDLDLHLLYIEVTSRGGCQQVIKDRKWKELTVAFNFPSTASGAAYILRKYYVGLLHHYEQVYYFQAQGPLVPPPISLPGPSAMSVVRDPSYSVSETVPGVRKIRKRNILPVQVVPVVDPALSIGSVVTGAIEGKFDQGYLVNITMGTEKLRGVLYHLPQLHKGSQHASVPNYAGTLGAEPQKPNGEEPSDHVHGQKRKRKGKDPNAPRVNRSGYNFFFGEQRMKLKAIYPDKDKELSRMIGDAWNKLTEEEKNPYQEQGVKDKERYLKEMKEYKELLKIHQGVIPEEIPMLRRKKRKNIKEEKPSEVATNSTHPNETVAVETELEHNFTDGAALQELNASMAAIPKLEEKDSVMHEPRELNASTAAVPELEDKDSVLHEPQELNASTAAVPELEDNASVLHEPQELNASTAAVPELEEKDSVLHEPQELNASTAAIPKLEEKDSVLHEPQELNPSMAAVPELEDKDSVLHEPQELNASTVAVPELEDKDSVLHEPQELNASTAAVPELEDKDSVLHEPQELNPSTAAVPHLEEKDSVLHEPEELNPSTAAVPELEDNDSVLHEPQEPNASTAAVPELEEKDSVLHEPEELNASTAAVPELEEKDSVLHEPQELNATTAAITKLEEKDSVLHEPEEPNASMAAVPMLEEDTVLHEPEELNASTAAVTKVEEKDSVLHEPQELNASTAAIRQLEDKDSVLHDLPVSSISPIQDRFEGNDEAEGISNQGAH